MMRVLRVQPSEPQAKLPESRRRALYLWLPPRVRMVWMRLAPIRVLAAWRPASKARFFPVDRGQNVCSSSKGESDTGFRLLYIMPGETNGRRSAWRRWPTACGGSREKYP